MEPHHGSPVNFIEKRYAMHLDGFDLIENSKGELVAINGDASSIKRFETFASAWLPVQPGAEFVKDGDHLVVTLSITLPVTGRAFFVQCKAKDVFRSPAADPSVSHIAMDFTGSVQIVAIKFRGKWIACWNIR